MAVTHTTSKDYDPKASHRTGPSEPMQASPLTGELVPASKMAEHMRIGLLDPRWREQKERWVPLLFLVLINRT